MFLDQTLGNIIKRFEHEFPDTRVSVADSGVDVDSPNGTGPDAGQRIPALTTVPSNLTGGASLSDGEDNEGAQSEDNNDAAIRPPLSRSTSLLSLSSKALADEEARVLRAGHKFRAGIVLDSTAHSPTATGPSSPRRPSSSPNPGLTDPTSTNGSNTAATAPTKQEHYAALLTSGVELVGADPNHQRLLHELLEEVGDEELKRDARERGVVRVFKERRGEILGGLRRKEEEGEWMRFVESQEMARRNAGVSNSPTGTGRENAGGAVGVEAGRGRATGDDEVAVED